MGVIPDQPVRNRRASSSREQRMRNLPGKQAAGSGRCTIVVAVYITTATYAVLFVRERVASHTTSHVRWFPLAQSVVLDRHLTVLPIPPRRSGPGRGGACRAYRQVHGSESTAHTRRSPAATNPPARQPSSPTPAHHRPRRPMQCDGNVTSHPRRWVKRVFHAVRT